MNLNALTNLTSTVEKPNIARDKATTDSGFEAAFQGANRAEDPASRREKDTDPTPRKTAESSDSSLETGRSQSESDTVQKSDTDPNGDPVAPAVTSTHTTRDTAIANGGPTPETHATSTSGTHPQLTGSDQVDGAASKSRVVPSGIDPDESARQAAEAQLLAKTPKNAPLNSASVPVAPSMNSDLDAAVAQTTAGAALALGAQISSDTDRKDMTAQTKGATAPVPTADLTPTADTSETTAKSGVLADENHAKTTTPLTSAMPAVANNDVATAASTNKATPPPAMSLLERHLGGYSVRLLPQDGQTPEGKTSGWPEGEAVKTPTNVAASASMNANAPSAAQALSRLVMPEKINAAQLQAELRVRGNLGSNASQGDVRYEVVGDMRLNSLPTGVGVTQPMAARPEVAAHVAQQIAEAMKASSSKSVEIALSPVELGRVRMVLSPSDAGITLSILADRPDTLDLMRRNIDDLSKSFSELGYDDISFSFGQNDQTADGESQNFRDRENQMTLQTELPDQPTTPTNSTAHLAIAPDGIDMRL